jgi:uncharacterized protein YoxC
MWKQVWEHFRLVITLTERVTRHDDDIREVRQGLKEVRDEVREINRKLDALVAVIQHLNTRIDHENENARHEQEKLVLRLDNTLLHFERRLPPAAPSDHSGTE